MTLSSTQNFLKHHTEVLVKDVGIEAASQLSGRSKASLNRYYSDLPEHADRFMPIDVVAALESASSFPHVTTALADLRGVILMHDDQRPNAPARGSVNSDVIALSQRFALLIAEYQTAIEDGTISANEARRLLNETLALQRVLIDMKLNLEREAT
ncbi:MAG: hypothetical protein H6900_07190 [Rhodobacter sp.]|uniref:hypothetical protein n=1 Tax=Pararhodobacter sp. TaxID=2127056 RepID=UPI002C5E20F2|nr:hypothetical protein [Pararhodobacter sp.]MCC0073059.1 hypothetical protein [Rhodobacter sp.]HPD94014.1 hypothetical protein [Pararhodobacter sp.]